MLFLCLLYFNIYGIYDDFCERMRYYALLKLKLLLIVLENLRPDDGLE